MLVTTANMVGLFTGFSTAFNNGLRAASTDDYLTIAMDAPSTGAANIYPFLGEMPQMREWVGDRVIRNLKSHDYTIPNVDFENTVSVDRNKIEDDQVGIYRPMFEGMGKAAAEHPAKRVFHALKNGFSTPCYDGQYFFDTDHPVEQEDGSIVSVSNMQAGSGPAWFLLDTSQPLKPLIVQRRKRPQLVRQDRPDGMNVFMQKKFLYGSDARTGVGYGMWQVAFGSRAELNAANYEAARVALGEMRGDGGRQLGIMPTHLVFPPSLEGAAMEILNADRNAAGATNVWRGTATPMKSAWLA